MFLGLAFCCLVFAWVSSATGRRLHDHLLSWIRHRHRHRHRHWLWHRHGHGHGHGGSSPSLTGTRCLTGSSASCTPCSSTQASQHLLETYRGIFLGSASLEGCTGLCLCMNRDHATFKILTIFGVVICFLLIYLMPITRGVQFIYFLATAFSQVGLFLDAAFFCGYILHITVNYALASDWLLKTNSWERLI